MKFRLALLAMLAATFVPAVATGALAAPTARASDPITIHAGPGNAYPIIGKLARNEVVSLSQCTPTGTWCRIVHKGPDGWVLGSYLIGSAAKVQATPWRPLVNPFAEPRRFGHFPFGR